MAAYFSILAWRTTWKVWKAKKIKNKNMTPEDKPLPDWKVSNMLPGKNGGQLLIAPERMKQLGQCRNDTQLWMCLVVKVIDAFELWCWKRHLRIPWTARRSNQWTLKETNPEYSLEGLMLRLKAQYFGHLMQRTDSLEKTLMLGKDWRQKEKGEAEEEMVR